MSLYIHVPYCETLCWFCACRTQAAEDNSVIDKYVEVLLQEIRMVRAELPDDITLSRVYMGGGTPTILNPEAMQRLVAEIYSSFDKADAFEFSVEIDTTQVSADLISRLLEHGMTRALIGVQDFDPEVQRVIGRAQTFEQTLNVVGMLRRAGLENLDMEMLYGLPAQTSKTIAETTQQVLALDPDRLAICEYSHVPTVSKRQILVDARKLPASEDAFLLSQIARHILLTDGYEPVGMDHFVRPDDTMITARDNKTLRRDFEGYSDNGAYALIGLGASAISRFPQGYVQNASSTSTYLDSIQDHHLAGNKGYGMSGNDHVIGAMIEMLMCFFEIEAETVIAKFPGSKETVHTTMTSLSKVYEPFVDLEKGVLVIKPFAHPMARLICDTLDRAGRGGKSQT
ncbi:MAG: radical SAM protein [Roseobacter sp.]